MRLTPEALKNIKAILVVISCLYIISGGFYNQLMEPGQYDYWNGNWYSISPDNQKQTTGESLLAFACNTTAFLGIYIVSVSWKRNKLTANRLMILGIALLLSGIIGSYILLEMKRIPWYQ